MDFFLNEEQKEFEASFRQFCDKEIAPRAEAVDETGVTDEIYKKLGQAGYLGLLHPEEHGGQGASFLTAVLAQSALAYHCGSTFFSSGASAGLFGLPISHFGSRPSSNQIQSDVGRNTGKFEEVIMRAHSHPKPRLR